MNEVFAYSRGAPSGINGNGSMQRIAVFGETYSANVGDGIIFSCLGHGLARRQASAIPADLSLRDGFGAPKIALTDEKITRLRGLARRLVRRHLLLRRLISMARWAGQDRRRFIEKYLPLIRSCDSVIIGGGQLLTDRQFGFPPRLLAVAEMARAAGKPVALFSCGVDVQQGFLARRILRRVVTQACYVGVRDRVSADTLQHLCPSTCVRLQPDIGFLTGQTFVRAREQRGREVLGVNIMPYETMAGFLSGASRLSQQRYLAFWEELIRLALEQGRTVRILTNGDPADVKAAKAIFTLFAGVDSVELPPPPSDPSELVRTLNEVGCLVASRMHAGIVAHSLGKQVVPLIWDEKVRGVWANADPTINAVAFSDILSGKISASRILHELDVQPRDRFKERETVVDRLNRSLDELVAALAASSSKVMGQAK